eukprot:4239404-Amphidinium_carterae.1
MARSTLAESAITSCEQRKDDVAAMYEILKGAKNPADLLMVSIRWMAEATLQTLHSRHGSC